MKDSRVYLRYCGSCRFQDKLWFPNGGFNGLFCIDLKDLEVEFKQRIPFLEPGIQWAFSENVNCMYDDKIFFFPLNCCQIMVYDVQSNSVEEIPIKAADGSDIYQTEGIIQVAEKVLVFPIKKAQGIFILDLKERKLKRNKELEDMLNEVEFIYNYGNIIRKNETEMVILSGKHTVIGIDIQNRKKTFIKQFEEFDIWGIRYDGSNFWLLLYESTDVYRWNPFDDRLFQYHLSEEVWINGKGKPYANMIFLDNQILLLPCSLKYIMRIDQETHTISKAVEYPAGFQFFDGLMTVSAFAAFDIIGPHKVLIHPVRGNMLLLYDVEKNSIEGKELTVTSGQVPYLQEIIKQEFQQGNDIVCEKDNFGVELLDLAIVQNRKNKSNEETGQIGRSIYNTLMR